MEETLEIFVTSFITFLQIINEKGLLLHKKEKIAPKESVQDSDHHKVIFILYFVLSQLNIIHFE